jgi:hypothetical protein
MSIVMRMLDKAKQALRDAVEELMQMEEIRGLVIGEPSFAGHCRADEYGLYPARVVHHPAAEAVDGALCARQHGEKHFDLANVRMPVQTYQVAAARIAAPQEPTL